MTEPPIDTFHMHRLSNGLQIIGQRMPDFDTVALAFYIRAGARDEGDPKVAGISHFLEHMVFKGTKNRPWQQLKQEFTRIGAEKNGATSVEYTRYRMRVLAEYLDHAVELLSDMMVPRLDENDFNAEKDVIINEIARSEDQPGRYTSRRMMHAYFQDHPLGNYVLGTRESIRNMPIEQMRNYWRQQYVANNILLSAVGNFDWEHFVQLAEYYCSRWPSGEATRIVSPYQPAQSSRNIIINTKLKQQHMMIAMPGVSKEDTDYYAAVLAENVLGDNQGSRLYWRIRHKGLAQIARCTLWTMEGAGIFFLEANTVPENAPQVLKLLGTELEALLNDGLSEEELRRAKDKWISSIVIDAESTTSRLLSFIYDWTRERHLISIDEKIKQIEQITTEDVMRVLHRFPLREKQVLTTLGPLNEQELFRE